MPSPTLVIEPVMSFPTGTFWGEAEVSAEWSARLERVHRFGIRSADCIMASGAEPRQKAGQKTKPFRLTRPKSLAMQGPFHKRASGQLRRANRPER